MRIIAHWIILSIAIWATTLFIEGVVVDPFWVSAVVGACLTLFNMFLRPVINILTLPLNFVTLGMFSLVVNGLIFWYLGTIIKGFAVEGFYAAFAGALVVSVLNWLITKVLRTDM
ncbi:MAG: phage holin family protein [Candidatus Pacebacteria bacterium]|nr:phage holin family protein [Candidatus Paceibacterota bacterium]MBP9716265.1 phage holin family protein [Candidatus Paceibacterota bacterium]